jgi:ribose/xylose/arabinose/galactoside ABC-type transport system permease subunit
MGDFARQMVTGAIIIVAVIIDTHRAKLSIQIAE